MTTNTPSYIRKAFSYLLLSGFLLLHACTPSSHALLEKAQSMESVSVDSIIFYLSQIKNPNKLSTLQQGDYYLLSYNATLWKTGIPKDSLLQAAISHYAKAKAYRQWIQARTEVAVSYLYREQPDSVLHAVKEIFKFAIPNDTLRIRLHAINRTAYRQKKQYPEALQEADSCRQLAVQLKDTLGYFNTTQQYLGILQKMERKQEFVDGYRALISELENSARFTHLNYYSVESLVNFYIQEKRFEEALAYSETLSSRRFNRKDVPYYFMLKGEIHEALHHTDSAKYYYNEATSSASNLLASEASSRLYQLIRNNECPELVYYARQKEKILRDNVLSHIQSEIKGKEFNELKLKNELYQLSINQQQQELWMMGITIILLLTALIVLFFYQREKKKRLLKECQLLYKETELSMLREKEVRLRHKEAELREALFRRISFFHKLPSLHNNDKKEDSLQSRKIEVTANEWKEVITVVNDAFDNFVVRLQKAYPLLGEKEIGFCCLLKINVNIQDLSDIYCVSKAAITKRKYRIKTDKLGLADETTSLDRFLQTF